MQQHHIAGREGGADMRNRIACIGPVTVYIDSTNTYIDKYMGGIFTPIAQNCKTTDHCMVAVGYTQAAYFIRNSWGKKWGENGYLMFDSTERDQNVQYSKTLSSSS